MKLSLIREILQTVETKGVLTTEAKAQFKTLELPWLENKNEVSCIPVGVYPWKKVAATKKIPYQHIAIDNVPGRSGVCIHSANYAAGKKVQLKGCIAVGANYLDLDGDKIEDITDSKKTFEKLMATLPNEGAIEIK